jgi:hypothetical protein
MLADAIKESLENAVKAVDEGGQMVTMRYVASQEEWFVILRLSKGTYDAHSSSLVVAINTALELAQS